MMIGEGKGFADTLNDARMLARHVEQHGYKRYWIAEHHDLPGIASSATTLLIADLAAATSTLRVGAGGIMLPNHSPLAVAEQFATLGTLYPGRIDLGLGRAAGAAGPSVRALRGGAPQRDFEQDIGVLTDYLLDNGRQPVRGIPGTHDIPLWILGSSMNSADLAARLGLPYAFASHFAPRFLRNAVAYYRAHFKPSTVLQEPYVIAGVNVFAADSEQEARFHASSHFHWVNLLHQGRPGPLPLPQEGYLERISDAERRGLQQALAWSVVGDVEQVGRWLKEFVALTKADELVIDARIHDPAARCRSYELAAQSMSA
jgi:luciferase family oxidoreductase group 1